MESPVVILAGSGEEVEDLRSLAFGRECSVEASLIQPVFKCSLHLRHLKSTFGGMKMHPKLSLPLGAYSQAEKAWVNITEEDEAQRNPQISAMGV